MNRAVLYLSLPIAFLLGFFISQSFTFPFLRFSYFPKETIVLEKREFNEDFIKKEKFDVFCKASLKDGILFGEDYFSVCNECIDYCPKIDFHFSIFNNNIIFSDISKNGEKEAVFILEKKIGEELPAFFLTAINSSFNHYPSVKIGKGIIIESFSIDKGKVNISFLSHEEDDFLCCPTKKEKKEYEIRADRLAEIKSLEKIKYRSISQGFEFEYPKSWKIKRVDNNSIVIYQPSLTYSFPIFIEYFLEEAGEPSLDFLSYNLENFIIKTRKETPYLDIFEEVKSSFRINKNSLLPDYSFFRKSLLEEEIFVEIDAEDMKIFLYKNGEKEKKYNILAKGDYEKWGGAPAGLYGVISKQTVAFSNISNAFMPYAIRIYGSYLIHGEPYYPGGARIISPFSGGCFRVKNNEMKDIFEEVEIETPILVIDKKNDNFTYKDKKIAPFPGFSADKYLVADIDSGFIILEKDIEKPQKIGSLTKLMTSLIMVENADINKRITARPYMSFEREYPSRIILGNSYRVADLFIPTIMGNINNATILLSHYFGIEETVKKMNEKTKMIMMEQTFFTDPTGEAKENVSTAKDLFYLTRYIKNNALPLFQISKGDDVLFVNKNIFPGLKNENIFYEKDNFMGGKKGDENSGIYIFNVWGRNIAFIVLGAKSEEQTKREIEDVIRWIEKTTKY